MADAMRDIKRRIKTIESTEHITNAMRLVSAAKFRRAKKQYDWVSGSPAEVLSLLESLLESGSEPNREVPSDMAVPEADHCSTEGGCIMVVFTSSRGLCGGYNSSIMKLAAETACQKSGVQVISVGSKGSDFFRRENWNLLASLDDGPEKLNRQDTACLTELILREWEEGRAAEILLVGMRYVNTLQQEPVVRRILPIPKEGRTKREIAPDMEFLPSKEAVMQRILPAYLQLALREAAAEAAVCEHAARRMAMENAADSAHDMMASLSLTYNRARQQAITEELIEIVSGSESLK